MHTSHIRNRLVVSLRAMLHGVCFIPWQASRPVSLDATL